jgi:hypothetical protein
MVMAISSVLLARERADHRALDHAAPAAGRK